MKKIFTLVVSLFAFIGAQAASGVTETVISETDFSNYDSYPFYSMLEGKEKVVDGNLVIENATEGLADWQVQYFVADQVPTEVNGDYVIRATLKGSSAGKLVCNVGDWSSQSTGVINFTDEWQTVDLDIVSVPAASSFVVFQSGAFVGTVYVSKVQVIKVEETSPVEKTPVTVVKFDYEDGNPPAGWGNGSTREVVDGSYNGTKCAVNDNPSEANSWECQVAIDLEEQLIPGETYYLHFWAKSDTEVAVNAAYQNPEDYSGRGDYPNFTLTTEWKEYELKTVITGENCKRLCFNLGKAVGKTYFDDVEIYYLTATGTGVSTAKVTTKVTDDKVYTIGGQRVANPTKGLYIINGKKVVRK